MHSSTDLTSLLPKPSTSKNHLGCDGDGSQLGAEDAEEADRTVPHSMSPRGRPFARSGSLADILAPSGGTGGIGGIASAGYYLPVLSTCQNIGKLDWIKSVTVVR